MSFCNHNDTLVIFIFIMPALTIKNIPINLYNELKHIAEQHHRSINSEVIVCLKERLFPQKISIENRLSDIQRLRAQITAESITTDDIENAINNGRP